MKETLRIDARNLLDADFIDGLAYTLHHLATVHHKRAGDVVVGGNGISRAKECLEACQMYDLFKAYREAAKGLENLADHLHRAEGELIKN